MSSVESLKTHNKFKKTEIGEIPVDWELTRLGDVVEKFINGGTPDTKEKSYWEGNIPWITGADFENQKVKKVRHYIAQNAVKNSSTNVIPGGSLLVVTRTGVGKLAVAPFDVAISQDITGVIPKITFPNSEFLYWHLNNFSHRLTAVIQGTSINGLLRGDLATFPIALPPNTEQKKIAEILSTVDAAIEKIDAVIEKTEQLKKGLMHQLLTRGIGHTKFKKTEIGKIPAEWRIKKLQEVAVIERGKFQHRPRNEPRFYGGKYPFVQTGDVTASNGRITSYTQSLNDEGLAISRLFPKGTILITIAANIADTGIAEFDVAFPDSLVGIVVNDEMDNRFLEYYLRTRKEHFNSLATQSAQKNINLETLRPYPAPVPPKPEQMKIAEILTDVDREIEKETFQKRMLEGLKKELMGLLLTGKIRTTF